MRFDAPSLIQLGPGMLITGLDLVREHSRDCLRELAETGASGTARLVGFTAPGGCVRLEPEWADEGCPTAAILWRKATCSGVLTNCSRQAFARLLGPVKVTRQDDCTVLEPRLSNGSGRRPEPLCWVAATGGGMLGVQLLGSASLGRVDFTFGEKEAGQLGFRFTCVQEEDDEPCCRFVWIGGDGT